MCALGNEAIDGAIALQLRVKVPRNFKLPQTAPKPQPPCPSNSRTGCGYRHARTLTQAESSRTQCPRPAEFSTMKRRTKSPLA